MSTRKGRSRKHDAVRAEQTLAKAARQQQQQPPRKISPALPQAVPKVRRKGKR